MLLFSVVYLIHEQKSRGEVEAKLKYILKVMKLIGRVQALEDPKFEQSPKGKGFKEAKCKCVLRDATSDDEYVATLSGNDALIKLKPNQLVMVKLKSKVRKTIDGDYIQENHVKSIEVIKEQIETFEDILQWEV